MSLPCFMFSSNSVQRNVRLIPFTSSLPRDGQCSPHVAELIDRCPRQVAMKWQPTLENEVNCIHAGAVARAAGTGVCVASPLSWRAAGRWVSLRLCERQSATFRFFLLWQLLARILPSRPCRVHRQPASMTGVRHRSLFHCKARLEFLTGLGFVHSC